MKWLNAALGYFHLIIVVYLGTSELLLVYSSRAYRLSSLLKYSEVAEISDSWIIHISKSWA